jgi:hypothetical protein
MSVFRLVFVLLAAWWVIQEAGEKGILTVLNPCYAGWSSNFQSSRDGWTKEIVDNSGLRDFTTPGDNGTGTNDWVLVAESRASQPRHTDSGDSPAQEEIAAADDPAARLAAYRGELAAFRKEYGGTRDLPDVHFYLFGMGQRTKFIYRDGRLLDARSGKAIREWKLKNDMIVPPDYLVSLEKADGAEVTIVEDEQAVWIEEGGQRVAMEGTQSAVRLPRFDGHRYARVLRVLHQELLVNITSAGPVPNFFVYPKPWYRDGAMMAMAFHETGNLDLIRGWILGLREPFDRNNGGVTEPDNLGQALYLISLVSDKNHPLVAQVLAELPRFEREEARGKYILGKSDFAEHPVYQTKWLKFGLRALALPDNYTVPLVPDGYSALFWMDYREAHVAGKDSDDRTAYPYLGWACDHFHGVKKSPISNRDYPLTWEQNASQAAYSGLAVLDPIYVEKRLSAPHTWHAAEVFLYVMHEGDHFGLHVDPDQ